MKHDWFYWKDLKYRVCRNCMVVENAKNTERDCRGKVRITLRDQPEAKAAREDGG